MTANEKRKAPLLLKTREVAEALAISQAYVYRLMDQGELSWVRMGRHRRVKASSVEAFVARNSAEGPAR